VDIVPAVKFLLFKFFEIVSRNQLPEGPEKFRAGDGFKRVVYATDSELDSDYKGRDLKFKIEPSHAGRFNFK